MLSRLGIFSVSALAIVAVWGCRTTDDPDPVFIQPLESDGDSDSDSDSDSDPVGPDDTGTECNPEDYPCGPYGHTRCEVMRNLSFIPANDDAEDLTGDNDFLELSDLFADESILGVLLFGTAGWCGVCTTEKQVLNEMYTNGDFENVDGRGGRIEFVAVVFEGMVPGVPATVQYAESYARTVGFPTVADTTGDILYYFDAASSPGNILINATEMRIQRIVQGFDEASIINTLRTLDGSVECR